MISAAIEDERLAVVGRFQPQDPTYEDEMIPALVAGISLAFAGGDIRPDDRTAKHSDVRRHGSPLVATRSGEPGRDRVLVLAQHIDGKVLDVDEFLQAVQ